MDLVLTLAQSACILYLVWANRAAEQRTRRWIGRYRDAAEQATAWENAWREVSERDGEVSK